MPKNKTIQNDNSVPEYLLRIQNEKRRKDCSDITSIITELTGLEPKMWGSGIIGFGRYHYTYESGHEGTAPLAGLSSRSNAIVLYLASSFQDKEELLLKLGKHKVGKGCIYVKKLEDIDKEVLKKMVKNSIQHIKEQYPN